MYKVLCERCHVISDVEPVECYARGKDYRLYRDYPTSGLLFRCPVCSNDWFVGMGEAIVPDSTDFRVKNLLSSCGASLFTFEERSPFEVT